MKIKFLLLGTSLSFLPTLSFAQCVETTNCETLGYTEITCNGGKGVKCPFGNKWFCFETEDEFKTRLCPELGFTLDCSGENQTGSSYSCNGKYNYCNCADGYYWKEGKCERTKLGQSGVVGDLYYCNGVVVGVKAPGMDFYIAMKDLGNMSWEGAVNSCQSYIFCNICDKLNGALPTKAQLLTMYNNKVSLNSLLLRNGGMKLTESYYRSNTLSSSYGYHYIVSMSDGDVKDNYLGNDDRGYYSVRPVLMVY